MEDVLQMLEVRKKDVQANMQVPLYRGMQIYDILGAGTQNIINLVVLSENCLQISQRNPKTVLRYQKD
ncbi:Psoralen synthase [Listeria monocytogenes N53-1]|nr:Psoralen synthase [Listeria monocytogenes N53-1]